jgi:hypothetical protein
MINRRKQIDIISIFKRIRSIYDITFILIGGSLWIFATLWDIYQLQRYWLDYCIEFYSSFLVFFMIIYSLYPNALPVKIYNALKLITTIRGRGIILIATSSLFLRDKHAFHKFAAIILFIGGLLYLVCEIMVPTTKEELNKVDSLYNKNNNNIINSSIIQTNGNKETANDINNNDNTNISMINNTVNNLIKDNGENNGGNNEIINDEIKVENINKEKEDEKIENKNEINTNVYENEIVRKTDNPYEIPEDF